METTEFKEQAIELAVRIRELIIEAGKDSTKEYTAPSRLKGNATIDAWFFAQQRLNTAMLCKVINSAIEVLEDAQMQQLAEVIRIPELLPEKSFNYIGEAVSLQRSCSKASQRFSKDKLMTTMLRLGVPRQQVINVVEDKVFRSAPVVSTRLRFTTDNDMLKADAVSELG